MTALKGFLVVALVTLAVVPALAEETLGVQRRSGPETAAASPPAQQPQAAVLWQSQAALASRPPAANEVPLPPRPAEPTLRVDADLVTQRVVITENGVVKYTWPISSGVRRYPTPTGIFRAIWTDELHHSRQWNWAPMPHAVFFSDGAAFHATNATGNLGSPASHGCVRLAPSNARILYNLVEKHGLRLTLVTVRGSPFSKDPGEATPRGRRKQYADDDRRVPKSRPAVRRIASDQRSAPDPTPPRKRTYARPQPGRSAPPPGPFGALWD